MPQNIYSYKLQNGKSLEFNGAEPPTDEQVEAAATENGVQLLPLDAPSAPIPNIPNAVPNTPNTNLPVNTYPPNIPVNTGANPDYGLRPDNTPKGQGFFGPIKLPNGVMTEYSIADSEQLKDAQGNYLDYPTLIPGLTKSEITAVMKSAQSEGKIPLPDSVKQKAEQFALSRKQKGLPLFATTDEEGKYKPDDDLPVPKPGVLKQAWDLASKPLTNVPSELGREFSQYATRPDLASAPTGQGGMLDNIAVNAARARGFLGGAMEGVGDLVSGLTSPINLAAIVASGGASLAGKAGLTGAASALNTISKATAIPLGAEGAYHALRPDADWSERGHGVLEIAGAGAQWLGGNTSKVEPKPGPAVATKPPTNTIAGATGAAIPPRVTEINPSNLAKAKVIISQYEGPGKMNGMADNEIIDYAAALKPDQFINAGTSKAADAPITAKPVTAADKSTANVQGTPPTNIPSAFTIKNGKGSPLLVKKLREKGYEYDVELPNGDVRFKYTGRKSSPLLEGEVSPKPGKNPSENTEVGLPRKIWDFARGAMSVDPPFVTSAAFRQASPLMGTKNWFTAWKTAAQSYGSQAAYDTLMKDISESPLFRERVIGDKKVKSYAEEIGVRMTDMRAPRKARLEGVKAQLAEQIPLYGRHVKASNRAFAGFLNDLRRNQLEQFVKDGQSFAAAHSDDTLDITKNIPLGKAYAEFLNDATGAGSLSVEMGKHKYNAEATRGAQILGDAFFSPRLMASRMRMMNPSTYIMAPPGVRKQYTLAMLRSIGGWWGLASLSKLAGAKVSTDPTDADFGKIRFRNTRLDPGQGFQQFLVLGSRLKPDAMHLPENWKTDTGIPAVDLASGFFTTPGGQITSSTSKETRQLGVGYRPDTRFSITTDFLSNKASPVASLLIDIARANEQQPVYMGDRMLQMALPMMTGDIIELMKEDPSMIPLVTAFGATGGGSQTYKGGPNPPTFTNPNYDWVIGPRTRTRR